MSLRAGGCGESFRRFCGGFRSLGLRLRLRLVLLLGFAALHLDATFEDGAVFPADAHGRDVSRDRAFAADIHAVAAVNVPTHLAHDNNFAGRDVGLHAAVAADGDAVVGQTDLALDAAIDIKRFRAADFALDDERTANGGLLDGRADGLDGVVRVRTRSRRGGPHAVYAIRVV